MSRRKQSNPKPLKREDVWGSDEEGGAVVGKPGSGAHSPAASAEQEEAIDMKMETDIVEDVRSPPASPPHQLRLRLNTSLATDPAQRKEQVQDRFSPEERSSSRSSRPELELLPGAAFPSVPASSPKTNSLFCLPPTPEANHVLPGASPTSTRVKQETPELPTPPPPRQLVNCFVCQPCGIRFSSLSTLEAHQTYYCSHRPSALAAAAALQNNTRSSSPSTPHTGGSGKGESDGELGSPRSGGPATDEDGPASKAPRTGRQYGCPHCSYSADKKVSLNRHMRMHAPAAPCPPPSPANTTAPSDSEAATDESAAPLPPPPLDRYCADCDIRFSSIKTYRAHKTHYCSTRHVVKPPPAISPAAASQTSSGAEDRVVVTRGSTASSPAGSPPAATAFLALPTSPVLLVPYQLVQAASLLSSHALPPGAATAAAGACLLLMDGTVRPLKLPSSNNPPPTTPEVQVTPRPPPKLQRQPSEQTVVREVPPSGGSPIPLDLSVPRLGLSSLQQQQPPSESPSPRPRPPDPEDEKENRGLNTSSPSLSSPSSSPSSASPRPPRQNGILPTVPKKQEPSENSSSGSPARKTPTLQVPLHKLPKPAILPELLAPLLGSHLALLPGPLQAPLLAAAAAAASSLPSSNHVTSPQILVKQGVSRCAECNIVFCKMENYIAHKKHYCSARRIDDSSSPESGVVTAKSSSPSPSLGQVPAATPPLVFPGKTHLQYICAACHIKFSSFDNLKAHQTYYCLKRDVTANNTASTNNNDPPPDRKKCPKCKVILPGDESASPHQCAVTLVSGGNSWRCPCCGISCPTATAAQKHLEEAHTGVLKAFRCTICRYRGNTLRGMRTHIRMHFSAADKTGELREEDFISCVLVGDPEPRPLEEEPRSPDDDKSMESLERNHCCEQCNYSSNYKGNLIRHMKSVHERSDSTTPPPPPSPEAIIVKLEPSEEKISLTEDPPPLSPSSPATDATVTARYCKSCDISFSYLSSFIAHKKFYCSGQPSSETPSALAVSPASTPRPEASAHT